MIVQCESCESRFRLDEGLVKEGGSKVRCSKCRSVFTVFPPESEASGIEDSEETVVLDGPPETEETEETAGPPMGGEGDGEFPDRAEYGVWGEPSEAFSPERSPEAEEEESGLDEALERAHRVEESLSREDAEAKGREKEARGERDGAVAGRRPSGRSMILPVFLGVVLVLAAAFAALYYLAPGLIPGPLSFLKPEAERSAADQGIRRLSFQGVKGAFVSTGGGSQRFVITGEVVNNYPEPRRRILIQAAILDSGGKVVLSRRAYAGNPIDEEVLRSAPMSELEEVMGAGKVRAGRNAGVPPGGTTPFTVVFEGLPEDVSEFTVEALSSEPVRSP